MTTNSLNNPPKITRTQALKAEKAQKLGAHDLLAVASLTGKKSDRENAKDVALGIVAKLLTGQAAGGNREAAVLALRACMGLEQAVFDSAWKGFSGSLADVAALGQWARPFLAARSILAQREEAARKAGLWAENAHKFDKERTSLDRAEGAKGAPKLAEKCRAFVTDIAPYIERAAEKLAARVAVAETAE